MWNALKAYQSEAKMICDNDGNQDNMGVKSCRARYQAPAISSRGWWATIRIRRRPEPVGPSR
jgi:hypothetical protein